MNITEEKVLQALSQVNDPDLQQDLVTLGMIKDLEANDESIRFAVELTTPACPMKEAIHQACVNAIRLLVSKDVPLSINITARVTSVRPQTNDILPNVKNIIAVASGKGGVGKSTIASNLAIGLALSGASVGLMDADIHGPSLHMMFGIKSEHPEIILKKGKNTIVPIERFGVKVLSIGLLVDEQSAIVWRGPMASSALRQFFTDVEWGDLDYLIIDLPPGTGDIHLTLVTMVPVTGAVIVTTPQEVALADAQKAISMFALSNINVPVLGVIENMSYFTPAELPENKYFLFGRDGGKLLSKRNNIPFIAEIPLIQSIREGGDLGIPAILDGQGPMVTALQNMSNNIAQQVAIQNAKTKWN